MGGGIGDWESPVLEQLQVLAHHSRHQFAMFFVLFWGSVHCTPSPVEMPPMINETEYPGDPDKGTLEDFVAGIKGDTVEAFYLKMQFEPNDDDDDADPDALFARVGGNTNLKALKEYHEIPVSQRRFGITQRNLIWRISKSQSYYVEMKEFPVDRMWNLLLDFAPKHGFKFRRTQYQGLAVRAHFQKDDLPF